MKKIRIVRGLRLVFPLRLMFPVPGYWKLEDDSTLLFQYLGKTRLGHAGARYSIDRWLTPAGDVETSLDAAVKRYFAKRGGA